MKAKAWILMLCIGMMCFTGFSNTTTDQTQNSVTVEYSDLDIGMDEAVYVVNDLKINDFGVQTSTLKNQKVFNQPQLSFLNFKQTDKVTFKPPLLIHKVKDNYKKDLNKPLNKNYNNSFRCPRDAIRCS